MSRRPPPVHQVSLDEAVARSRSLWPLRYKHSPGSWLRCATCPRVGQVRDMREVLQVRTWQANTTETAHELEPPRRVFVCGPAVATPECLSQQAKYCRDAPQGT